MFSNSLTAADWDETTIASGDLAEAITRLKQERSAGYLLAHVFAAGVNVDSLDASKCDPGAQ